MLVARRRREMLGMVEDDSIDVVECGILGYFINKSRRRRIKRSIACVE